jgi:hypothetical protein
VRPPTEKLEVLQRDRDLLHPVLATDRDRVSEAGDEAHQDLLAKFAGRALERGAQRAARLCEREEVNPVDGRKDGREWARRGEYVRQRRAGHAVRREDAGSSRRGGTARRRGPRGPCRALWVGFRRAVEGFLGRRRGERAQAGRPRLVRHRDQSRPRASQERMGIVRSEFIRRERVLGAELCRVEEGPRRYQFVQHRDQSRARALRVCGGVVRAVKCWFVFGAELCRVGERAERARWGWGCFPGRGGGQGFVGC